MEQPERTAAFPARRAVGGYELLRVLGSGGMGTVHEAVDADGRHVALKLLHPAFSTDDAARARLRREVATLHRVRGPRVARVLDAEADADEAFVVTELIDGQSLDDSIREHGPMDVEELDDLGRGLADALAQIHAAGVVHRDMKPGNVMLTDDGPVVIDFGISQVADDARLTQTGLVTGTPGYVDPAVLAGGTPGPAGDWWGWAAVLVFAATGRAPFGTGPLAAVLARVETGRVDVDGLPPGVAGALRAALHPDARQRAPHGVVLRALDDHLNGRAATQLVDPGADATGRLGAAAVLPPSFAPRGTAPVPQPQQWAPERAEPVWQAPPPVHPPAPPQQQPLPATPGPAPAGAPQGVDGERREWPAWALPARSRPGITFSWWLGVVGAATLWPGWTLLAVAAVLLVGGTVGSSARALRNRRLRHGLRRSDVAVASVSAPVHAAVGAALLLPGALVGVLGGGIVWGLAAPGAFGDGGSPELRSLVLAVAVAVTTLLAWWTPSSTAAREGVWAVLDLVAPSAVTTWVWVVSGLAVAAATAVVVVGLAPPAVWAPLPQPPIPSFLP